MRLGLCIQLSGVLDDGRLGCRILQGILGVFRVPFAENVVVVDGHFLSACKSRRDSLIFQ